MKTCHVCKKILTAGSKHIYWCSIKNNVSQNKKEIKFQFIKYNFPELSNEYKLKKIYESELCSLPDIKKQYNIDFKSILFLLDYYGIQKRTSSESAIKISHNKYVNTCMEKYGVNNVSKTIKVKEQKANTFIKNYGVDNVRKSDEFKAWLKDYMHDTYGVGSLPNINGKADLWGWKKLTHKEKEERIAKLCSNYKNNKLETRVQNALNEIGISYTAQFFWEIVLNIHMILS